MNDWKFGDVLSLASAGHLPHRIMFISRKHPFEQDDGGIVKFWGFEGIGLPSECHEHWRTCGQDHAVGQMGGFGGHPEARWGDKGWTLEEEKP